MNDTLVSKIKNNPNYQQLVKTRTSFAIKLGIFILAIFYAFILVIAFEPSILGIKTGDGVMTIAFPIAAGIIIVSFITTLIYVKRANTEFEDLIEKVREDVRGEL